MLRLTIPDTFGRLVILPLLKRFLAEWPEVQAEVSFSDRPSDIVEEGFDLALRVDYAAPDTQLVSRVIAHYERVLVAAPWGSTENYHAVNPGCMARKMLISGYYGCGSFGIVVSAQIDIPLHLTQVLVCQAANF